MYLLLFIAAHIQPDFRNSCKYSRIAAASSAVWDAAAA
jgi:hypothetical protein